jgi:phytanoyl-CoA hydroxylase
MDTIQKESLRESYQTNGYVICRNLISEEPIDKVLNLYKEQIVPSKSAFFRQMTNKFELNEFNDYGYVKQDFLDIHNYKDFPEFSQSVKEILCSDAIKNTLKQIEGSDSLRLMQSLLFDLNRETVPHQDSYYLDTIPSGHALAVWIALEDIDERAGRFYVMPGTTTVDLHSDSPNLSHWEWLGRMRAYYEPRKAQIDAPALKKGDAVFWNARLVHGALPIVDQRFSRKSMTAHYIPLEYEFVNLFASKTFSELETFNGVKVYSATGANSSEWSNKQMSDRVEA